MDTPPVEPPPVEPGMPELEAPPPAWPKVVGIISIVFGSIGLLCGLMQGIGGPAIAEVMLDAANMEIDPDNPPPGMTLNPTIVALTLLGAGLNILLIIAGAICAARSPNGRPLHLVYAFLMIVAAVVTAYFAYQQQLALQEWVKENPGSPIAQQQNQPGAQISATVGLFVGIAITMAWPFFCIIWFGAMGKRPEVGKPEIL